MNSAAAIAATHLEETFAFLQDLVGINSFTTNPAGIRDVALRIAKQFEGLGFTSVLHPPIDPAHGPHLSLRRAAPPGAPSVALISHLDTVFPAEEEERFNFRYRREGRRIYGPGSNDIKGGTALIWLNLLTLRAVAPELFESVNWYVLHNACEEVISTDFGRVCREVLPADTRACLIFEGDGNTGEDWTLVRSRKGRGVFRIDVQGRASHAGSAHREGINAITHLARIVTSLEALTDYSENVTVNVGSIRGGTVVNRVPHEASVELEMRAFAPETFARVKNQILAHASPHLPRVVVHANDETRPWPRNAATDELLAVWERAALAEGVKLNSQDRGGLSDGNALWDLWPTLDGLGPRGENCHCAESSPDGSKVPEWVDADSFVPKVALNCRALSLLLAPS
jgi:glutamate carboxypeptidase